MGNTPSQRITTGQRLLALLPRARPWPVRKLGHAAADGHPRKHTYQGDGPAISRLLQIKALVLRGVVAACLSVTGLSISSLAQAANVDLQVSTFTDSPDPAPRGAQITYTTVVSNGGPAEATDVVVTWPVPANTSFVSVSDGAGGGTCAHNGGTPGVVTCSYASFPAENNDGAGTKTITLVVQTGASTPGTVLSSVAVSQTGNTDTNAANNTLTQNTTINTGADLSFAIIGAPNPSVGAGNVTWSISGSNLGPDTSGPITVTVPIPAALTYVSGTGTGWSCSYSAPNAVCTRAAVASGVAYSALAIVTKISSQISGGTLTVGGNIGQTTVADPVSGNNSATASVLVNPGMDLRITQDVPSPSSANAGGTSMTFVLRPSNLGPYDATTGANVSFPLPAGFTLTSATGTNGWTCSSAGDPITVTCSLGSNFASGANSVLTILTGTPATVTASTPYTLTGTVAVNPGGPTDPIADNNTAARTVTVTPIGLDLSVAKTKTPALVAEGATLTTTITIASAAGGVQAAAGTITVIDVLDPAFETFLGSSGTNWSCSASALPAASQTVTCIYNTTLNGGSSASALTITTTAVAAGTATNNASVSYSGTPGDYNPANNGPVSQSTVTTALAGNAPDLIAGLTVTTAGGTANRLETNESTVSYIATLTNNAATADDAVNTRMTLTIPARVTGTSMGAIGVVVTNTSGSSTATYTCTPAAGVIDTSTIVCNQVAGTLLKPGDLVTFTVPINRALLDGTFTNPPSVAVTSTTQGDPTPANNTATATVIIDPIADIELVSKNITSANPTQAGTAVTYVVTIRNNGPSSAADVSLADVFTIPGGGDTGFTFLSAVASNSGTCGGLTANTVYASGTPTLTCSWGTAVASAATRTVTVTIRPNWMTGDPVRTLSNIATVTTTTVENPAGGDNGNNSKTATLTINAAQVDALINNTDVPDPLGYDPAAGAIGTASTNNDVTYNVALTNNGPSLVSGLGFTYTMTAPAGKTITFRGDGASASVASTTTSGPIAGSICNNVGTAVTGATLTLTCTFAAPGQLANLATVNRYLVFRVGSPPVTAGDTYTTNATVITNETDSNSSNNSELESTTVRQRVDLTIAKTPSINPVQLRQPFNWTITLTNVGPGNSDTTTLTDTLPAGMAFFGEAPSFTTTGVVKTGTCGVLGQVLTCNISTGSASPFNVNEVATITVPVRMTAYPSGGTTQNCASATTDQVDPASGNNTSVCTNLTVQRSSIAGRVFNDPNRDGLFTYTTGATGTDAGMNLNNIMTLTGTDVYGNSVSLTQTTAGSAAGAGAYLFNDLSPADATGYTLTETQPATHINGPTDPPAPTLSGTPTAGDQGVYASGGLAGNSSYTSIKLAANQAGTNYDFPELRRPSLSGRVYVDVNANNSYTSGTDTNISGASVVLRDTADLTNSVATTVTAVDGTYSFTGLNPLLTYVLEEPLPATPAGLGNRATAVNVGTVNAVATGTAAANTPAVNTDRITGIDLSLGVDGVGYNFGEDLATTISGVVFNDRNRDGAKASDAAEPGIDGVSLKLVAGTDCSAAAFAYTGLVNPATTAVTTGAYSFSPVPAGAQYTICETQPTGYADGPVGPSASITIASLLSTGSTGNNFPEVLGSISGKVFADFGSGTAGNNNNGTQQASEPGIGSATANAGVPVTLTGTPSAGPALPAGGITVYTDASGDYSFADLFPGNYTLTQKAIPSALGVYNNGINTAGPVTPAGTPGMAGAVGVNTISSLVLAAGSVSPANNFAKMPVTAITGAVYIDLNSNSTKDATPTDGRIGGATLNLYQATGCTGTPVATTTTGADGAYIFSTVSAGLAYTICETQPLGYGDAAVNPGTDATTPGTNVITIATLASTGSVGNDFGEIIGSIAGSVYRDFGAAAPAIRNNGIKETGELGIANVPVTIFGTDAAGASVNLTVSTDATGAYVFSNLLAPNAGGYTIAQGAIPAASGSYSDGQDTAGNATVAPGNATAVNDRISGIRMAGGENATGYNFGELEPPVIPTTFPDLVVTKTTPSARIAEGQTLNYTLQVKNAGPVATLGSYTVTDTLPATTGTPPKWTLQSAVGTGWTCTITTDKLSVSCSHSTVLQPGALNPSAIALSVKVGTGAAAFSPLRNVVQVSGGGELDDKKPQPPELASPPVCATTPEFNVCQLATPIDASQPDLVVTKSASKALFTEGTTAGYVLRVKNLGSAATEGSYTVTDTLPATTGTPPKWTLESASGSGWTCAIGADKLTVSCSHSAVLQPGEENASVINLAVNIGTGAAAFGPLRNTVQVSGGGEPDDKKPQPPELASPPVCAASPEFNVCQLTVPLQRSAGLSGSVWLDGGTKNVLDSSDRRLPQWIVEVYDVSDAASTGGTFSDLVRGGGAIRRLVTDSQGYYEVCGLEPGSTYRVLFRDPASRIAFPGVVTNEQGTVTGSDFFSQVKERDGFEVLEVRLPAGDGGPGCGGQGIAAPQQSLPLDPSGVVYDSSSRSPVPGAKVTLLPQGMCTGYNPQLHIINYETYGRDAQGNPVMTVGADGFYKFLLSGDPTAPQSCQFRIEVEAPAGYKPPPSTLISPKPPLATPLGAGVFNVQPQASAPTGNQDTSYHFVFNFGLAHQEIFNNHIPLDPFLLGNIVLTKQGDKRVAAVGDTVLYTITVRLQQGDPAAQVTVRDRLPAGLTLIRGTVRVNNLPAPDPLGGVGPVLGFNLGALQPNVEVRLTYRVRVGVGAMQGDGINRAQAHACQVPAGCVDPISLQPLPGTVNSNEGQHKTEVTGGVFTDSACVLGKVFVDCNNNHIQDSEELGIPGVRLYFSDGRFVVSDSEGKYSRCGLTPRSHVLAPDPTTLPRGARLTTSSNRNLGDGNSLFIDLKNGELHRADFIEGSCSNPVIEQVKGRRTQGEVRSVETEKPAGPALQFLSKPLGTPQQGTDSANQPLVQPRQGVRDAR